MRSQASSRLGLLLSFALVGCTDDPSSPTDTGSSSDGTADASTTGTDTTALTDGGSDDDAPTGDSTGEVDPGEPLPPGDVGQWIYVEIEGMFCRDGSPAGVGVRYADNSDLVALYFEGGGACFNEFSCMVNPSDIPSTKFDPGPFGGLFDDQNPDNPLMDHNFVYFPYCTGDAFFGSNPDGDVPDGPQDQMFVGHDNVLLALERIVDTFPSPAHVIVTGTSGGGFGAAANYHSIASAYPDHEVALVNDSGPIFRDMFLAPCLQQQWRDVWGLDEALPPDCTDCFGPDGGGLSAYFGYLHDRYPTAPKGLISSHEDGIISLFFGYGADQCMASGPSFPEFEAALYDLRDTVMTTEDFGTYFKTGSSHTYLAKDDYYTLEVSDVLLVDWVTDLIAGQTAHVAP